MLDERDTFVTRVTAEALLRRGDRARLLVLAEALGSADVQHRDHVGHGAFFVFASERDAAVQVCEDLLRDGDDDVRRGAALLLRWLRGLDPILVPVERG